MRTKDLHGDWKQVEVAIQISVEGKSSNQVAEISKMLEDFVSTTLVSPHRLTLSLIESKTATIPYRVAKRVIVFTHS